MSVAGALIPARKRPGPVNMGGSAAGRTSSTDKKGSFQRKIPRRKISAQQGKQSIEEWLESVKVGFASRFGALFTEAGWEDVADLHDYPPSPSELAAFLKDSVKRPQLYRLIQAVHDLRMEACQHLHLMEELDAIQPGLRRLAPYLIASGHVLSADPPLTAAPALMRPLEGLGNMQSEIDRIVAAIDSRQGTTATGPLSTQSGQQPPTALRASQRAIPHATGAAAINAAGLSDSRPNHSSTNATGMLTAASTGDQAVSSSSSNHPAAFSVETPVKGQGQGQGHGHDGGSEEAHTPHKYLTLASSSTVPCAATGDVLLSHDSAARTASNSAKGRQPAAASPSPLPDAVVQDLPIEPTLSRALLPHKKHAFLSYQWDVQQQVTEIKMLLTHRNVKCWMDIDGGMKSDIYDSMAEGVQAAACVVCFMSQAYQESANCKLELKFAQQSGVPIIPVMMQSKFAARGWLGILTAGLLWTPMHEAATVDGGIEKLINQMLLVVPGAFDGSCASRAETETDDASEAGSDAGIEAWGEGIFSYSETREELERLRKVELGGTSPNNAEGTEEESLLYSIPALAVQPPTGILITSAMKAIRKAVLSYSSPMQIGFVGMGGIGKTTVSSWVAREVEVRSKFKMLAWVSLGQTPVLENCVAVLYLQLTGYEIEKGLTAEEQDEKLKQVFAKKSILLVLDDCWDPDVVIRFNFLDDTTNSKMLISSRIRDVLDGSLIIDIAVPSIEDASRMLLNVSGYVSPDGAPAPRKEIGLVVNMCKRLPLTIGIAGKLIKQMAFTGAEGWSGVVDLLKDELAAAAGDSVEESVIRASVKALPKKIRRQVVQMFVSFALIPEDVVLPLPVLGMIYEACGAVGDEPVSRLRIRQYLKVLIDRSLVLGTVDQPQLHDIVWEYTRTELVGEKFKVAQRRLVETFRTLKRDKVSDIGRYIEQNIGHHIGCACDDAWLKSAQAISWLEDLVDGIADNVAIETGRLMPIKALAEEAEATERWWSAALRWNVCAAVEARAGSTQSAGLPFQRKSMDAADKAKPGDRINSSESLSSVTKDTFCIHGLVFILSAFHAIDVHYGPRLAALAATEAAKRNPLSGYSATIYTEFYPHFIAGSNHCAMASGVYSAAINCGSSAFNETLDLDDDLRDLCKAAFHAWGGLGLDMINRYATSFDWNEWGGEGGWKLVDCLRSYDHETQSMQLGTLYGNDAAVGAPTCGVSLMMHYGDAVHANEEADCKLATLTTTVSKPSPYRAFELLLGIAVWPLWLHLLGRKDDVARFFELHGEGMNFLNAEEFMDVTMVQPVGGVFRPLGEESEECANQLSTSRIVWMAKCMMILDGNVPKADGKAFLESLPSNETMIRQSLYRGKLDVGSLIGVYNYLPYALAHEKLAMYDGALRMIELALESKKERGWQGQLWHVPATICCKGRVLAAMGKPKEAMVAFEAAVEMCLVDPKTFRLVAALALRELRDHCSLVGSTQRVHSAQAQLDAKLKEFDVSMTPEQFGKLSLGLL